MNMNLKQRQIGFTLVELLVAIAVLSIVVALIIPLVRLVNKYRNVRESARVIGSEISAAHDQAVARGAAGIGIERNPNFVAPTNPQNHPDGLSNQVFFAGTRLYTLRRKPDFTGDSDDDFLIAYGLDSPNDSDSDIDFIQCMMTAPLDHVPDNNRFVIRVGDVLFLEDGERYRINEVLDVIEVSYDGESEFVLRFNIEWDDDFVDGNELDTEDGIDAKTAEPAPELSDFANIDTDGGIELDNFRFERLRRDRNSIIDLPEGYIIDLRYSGPVNSGLGNNDPETNTIAGLEAVNANDFFVLFDDQGALSEFAFTVPIDIDNDGVDEDIYQIMLAGESLQLFVNEYDPNNVAVNTEQQALALLSGEDSLWLTIGMNGGANIGYNVAPVLPPPTLPLDERLRMMINEARSLSNDRTSALQ